MNCKKLVHVMIAIQAIIIIGVKSDGSVIEWNYDELGPDVWSHEIKACHGEHQSPINIDESLTEYDKNLKEFEFFGYSETLKWNVTHNGHTVLVNPIEMPLNRVSIRGSDFELEYYLQQIHFHWGINNYQGSEHLINTQKYPLEMHMVHSSLNAQNFTVFSFLFELSDFNNTQLDTLLNSISHAKHINETSELQMSINELLPSKELLKDYYRYLGSLTTPPCTEGIIWNIFKEKIKISKQQMYIFHSNMLKNNFRDPQKLHHRAVLTSFHVNVTSSGDNNHVSYHNTAINLKNTLYLLTMLYVIIKKFF